jgi:hypothetical protein
LFQSLIAFSSTFDSTFAMKVIALLLAPVYSADVKWVTFDGADDTTAPWKVKNDPVMGGGSTANLTTTADKTGLFQGSCNIVSSLGAPGFASMQAKKEFADIQGFAGIVLKVKSSTPDYQGFKVSFGAPGVPAKKGPAFGPKLDGTYKAGFFLKGADWQVVQVPRGDFSYDWSPFTGKCDTLDPTTVQHECCPDSGSEVSNPDVCVDSKYLSIVNTLQVYAEGVEGEFNLEIESIGATTSAEVQV